VKRKVRTRPATWTMTPFPIRCSSGMFFPSQAVILNQVLSQSFDKTCYPKTIVIKS
jgi:hypothetical protein